MEDRGSHLVFIDRFFPSSKLSSNCGFRKEDLKLKDRKWTCPKCKTRYDSVVNASINIKKEGIKLLKA
ncbi:MAG: zinc ribbon domain-containing protein [Candidatus Helarchaeota archaeon]